ncbi:MAG TPA: TRAP transporter small permease [Smithellaceae bacterium]|nr:TRAP transporter small permease [Smithellaceae bacterium]HQM44396.1 TRAP transporter small permease [Smithellaceae bacterium]
MLRTIKYLEKAGKGFNIVACIAVIAMMLLSTADVVLRMLGKPIPGAYELVGFLATIVVSFSLGFTTLEKGHIAVEIFFRKMPQRVQMVMESVSDLAGFLLFGMMTRQAFNYAWEMRESGEVSATLQMPVYPFIGGMALGFGLLSIIVLADSVKSLKRVLSA